jgi:Ca2+/Na+ antiporter
MGVWMPVLVASFFYKAYAKRIDRFGNYKFALIWLLISIFLLSVIPTKKERYLLPAIVPMCLMVAYMLYSFYQDLRQHQLRKTDKRFIQIFSLILFVPAMLLPPLSMIQDQYQVKTASIIGLFLLEVLSVLAIISLKKEDFIRIFYLIIITVCVSTAFLLPQGIEIYYNNPDFNSLSNARKLYEVKHSPLYGLSEKGDPRVVWLIGKPLQYLSADEIQSYSGPPFCLFTTIPPPIVYDQQHEVLRSEDLGTYEIFRKDSDLKVKVTYYQPKN